MLKAAILKAAHDLIGPALDEPNVHTEYIRGVVELTGDLLGVSGDGDRHDEVLTLIRNTTAPDGKSITASADSFTCTEHGDKCVTIAECAETQGYVWNYPATAR